MAVNISQLNISNVSFGKLARSKTGTVQIPITYSGETPLNIRILTDYIDKKGALQCGDGSIRNPDMIRAFIKFEGCDPYGKQKVTLTNEKSLLYNFLVDLDERITRQACECSKDWFGKSRPIEYIRDVYTPSIRLAMEKKNGNYVESGKHDPYLGLLINHAEFNRDESYTISPNIFIRQGQMGVTWTLNIASNLST